MGETNSKVPISYHAGNKVFCGLPPVSRTYDSRSSTGSVGRGSIAQLPPGFTHCIAQITIWIKKLRFPPVGGLICPPTSHLINYLDMLIAKPVIYNDPINIHKSKLKNQKG
jgi:hypothetical protein